MLRRPDRPSCEGKRLSWQPFSFTPRAWPGRPGLAPLQRRTARGLEAAVRSLLDTDHPDAEVIVVVEPDALRRLLQPVRDPTVGAVSGNTRVGNRHGLLGRWQHIEHVLGFHLDRRMYDR